MNDFQKEILKTIDIMADKKIEQIQLDKTIIATITAHPTPSQNLYRILYQGIEYDVFSSTNESYSVNDSVLVLVPDNQFSNKKIILMKEPKVAEALTTASGGGTSTVNDGTLTMATSGLGLSGSANFSANTSSNASFTVTSNATSSNVASTIVARDASGGFSSSLLTASSIMITKDLISGNTIRQFAGGYNATHTANILYELATLDLQNNSSNFTIFGEVGVTASQSNGIARFILGIRANTLPSKALRLLKEQILIMNLNIDIKVYEDTASNIIKIGYISTDTPQNVHWTLKVAERANYDDLTQSTSLTVLDTTGLTEILETSNIGTSSLSISSRALDLYNTKTTTINFGGSATSINMGISGGTVSVAGSLSSNQLISTVTTGTAPLIVDSNTKVTNLNADLLDGSSSEYYLNYNNLTNSPTIGDGTLTLATSGLGISGSTTFTANTTSNSTFTVTSNATSSNVASTIIARTAQGSFSATDMSLSGQGLFAPGGLGTPSISFSSDIDTGIYNPIADNLAFVEGGTEVMRIDASDRLLIGLTASFTGLTSNTNISPRLQIAGTTLSTAGMGLNRFSDDTVGFRTVFTKSRTSSIGQHVIVNSGDELGSLSFGGSDGSQAREAARIQVSVDSAPSSAVMPGRIAFFTSPTSSASPAERMRIDSSGNIGIGTGSPNAKLNIVKSETGTVEIMSLNNNQTEAIVGTAIKLGYGSSGYGTRIVNEGNPSTDFPGSLVFERGIGSSTYAESMRINNIGNVGIGTTDPLTELHINRNTGSPAYTIITSANLIVTGANASSNVLEIDAFGGTSQVIGRRANTSLATPTAVANNNNVLILAGRAYNGTAYPTTDGARIAFNTNGAQTTTASAQNIIFSNTNAGTTSLAEAMRITGPGELLIGYTTTNTTATSYKLQVNSQIFATSGTIATSDGNYKENIEPLIDALNIVNSLNPISFNWKSHPTHNFDLKNKTVGFIAQEVQEVLKDKPYVNSIVKQNQTTYYNENDEEINEPFLGIAEGNLIAILTRAIQEQQEQINTLKLEVEQLKTMVQ